MGPLAPIHHLKPQDALFPRSLVGISSSPKELYVMGNLEPLAHTKVVSIVGSRGVTPYGRQVTQLLATELAQRGLAIVSGLAMGVDAIAHQAAVEAGGYTIAVLAHGLDTIQPSSNRNLAKAILDHGGAIISEYPPQTTPYKNNFVARNRLVAGLCDALLVTEAGQKSGAQYTVGFAIQQNKTVLAVPGDITSGMSVGTNNLLKDGSILVTDVADILLALGLEGSSTQVATRGTTVEEEAILTCLRKGIKDINKLQAATGLSADSFGYNLTMLEIAGKVRPLGGGQWGIR